MIYLFDTNVCIAAVRGNERVIRRLKACGPEDCAGSMVTVFEPLAGACRCCDHLRRYKPEDRQCRGCINACVSKFHFGDGRQPHALLLEMFTDGGIGTEVVM